VTTAGGRTVDVFTTVVGTGGTPTLDEADEGYLKSQTRHKKKERQEVCMAKRR
jgi:hypothetical protein